MSMGQATGPIYTCETTGHAPVAVLDAHQSAVGAPYEANLHPNSQCMSQAAAKQVSAVHLTVCKPMASHWSALHMHKPPPWCMGQTGPRGAVRRLCGAGVKTEAPRQVRCYT